jgi:hypothetical protein
LIHFILIFSDLPRWLSDVFVTDRLHVLHRGFRRC